jgi:hypothetical protein
MITFLGYKVSSKGSRLLEEWVAHLQNCRPPKTISQLCRFLRMLNFYICHGVTPLGDFTLPATHFLHVHIDLVVPLPMSAGYTYCFTAADRFTQWPEAISILDITADTGTCALDWLDIPFRLPADHHHRPGTSVWVRTLPLPGQIMWYLTFAHNRSSPCSQQTRGTFPPDTEGSRHVSRRSTLDRGASPRPSRNPYLF